MSSNIALCERSIILLIEISNSDRGEHGSKEQNTFL